MSKKIINKLVDTCYDVNYTKLTTIIENFTKLIEVHGTSAELIIEDGYDGCKDYSIYADVLETDEEYVYRLEREDKEIKRRQERELEELARLKAKYGEK